MLKIAICCGGGFSSSALASHLEKSIKKEKLDKDFSFIFIPFLELEKRQKEVDIAMLCPHLQWALKEKAKLFNIPITVIPPRLYGLMSARDFIEDAQDIISLWNKNNINPVYFDDEPNILKVTRNVSHRRFLKGEKFNYSSNS